MPIIDYLEKNARLYGAEVALVEGVGVTLGTVLTAGTAIVCTFTH